MEKRNMRNEVWRSLRDGDFQEDDVWDVLDGYGNLYNTLKPSFSHQSLLVTAPRVILDQSKGRVEPVRQHSAPVNVPDWSILHGRKTKKVVNDQDDADADGDDDGNDDDDDDVSAEEYFMRRSQSSSSSSSSVTEGVGRKLRGRDLRKVRNAVLKKTGFLE